MARQIATIRYKTVNNRVVFNDGFWREAVVRIMGVYGTTAPEYTCISLRERTSAHFVRLRTPDLGLAFVLD